MDDLKEKLDLATRHVARGKELVARQVDIIDVLRAAGHATLSAEDTLKAFIEAMEVFESQERLLRAEIEHGASAEIGGEQDAA